MTDNKPTKNNFFEELIKENIYLINHFNKKDCSNFENVKTNIKHVDEVSRVNNFKRKILDQNIGTHRPNDILIGHFNSRGNSNGKELYLGPNDGLYYINKNDNFTYLSNDQKNAKCIRFL
jgi:hypothetical protein